MTSGLTCNINGIPPQQRARYGWLVETLRRAIEDRRKLPDGYAFQMDTTQIGTGFSFSVGSADRRQPSLSTTE
jgi:hypothetical protein